MSRTLAISMVLAVSVAAVSLSCCKPKAAPVGVVHPPDAARQADEASPDLLKLIRTITAELKTPQGDEDFIGDAMGYTNTDAVTRGFEQLRRLRDQASGVDREVATLAMGILALSGSQDMRDAMLADTESLFAGTSWRAYLAGLNLSGFASSNTNNTFGQRCIEACGRIDRLLSRPAPNEPRDSQTVQLLCKLSFADLSSKWDCVAKLWAAGLAFTRMDLDRKEAPYWRQRAIGQFEAIIRDCPGSRSAFQAQGGLNSLLLTPITPLE
ncbi:MAG: hypothetical protein K2W85_14410 [Phycisphaerales bacterium]|nr:hypothetical protein [Phycisphaerales bacterium]